MSDTITLEHAIKRSRPLTGWLYRLKDWTESLAEHPWAVPALFILSFLESSFFPIPPDVLLIALCVSNPKRSFYYAAVCSVASVLGGVLGYGMGYALWYNGAQYSALAQFFFSHVPGFTEAKFAGVGRLFEEWNFWVIFTAGFTPVPYKIFTIASGVFGISFPMFVMASFVGRAGRFFLVAAFLWGFGPKIKECLERYLEILSVGFAALLIGGVILVKYLM